MQSKIVSYEDFVAGWLDSSVHDFLGVLPRDMAGAQYALITCLDSNPTPASLLEKSPELTGIAKRAELLGHGLLLPADVLLEADSRKRIFFGFDEVWFFPDKNIEAKPPSASLVGPSRITQARFDKLGRWIKANSCSLALGGGEGLNFVVRASGLAMYMLGHSIEQHESSLASV